MLISLITLSGFDPYAYKEELITEQWLSNCGVSPTGGIAYVGEKHKMKLS